MREFVRILIVAAAVLAVYFGYMYFSRPEAYQARARAAGLLMGRLDDYYAAKGACPILPGADVPVIQLDEVLAASGVTFRSRPRSSNLDPDGRYMSVDGKSYGLLWHFQQSGRPVPCSVEIRAYHGWWGYPPHCRW